MRTLRCNGEQICQPRPRCNREELHETSYLRQGHRDRRRRPTRGHDDAEICKGVVPFVGIQVFALGLVALFPALTTWLPKAVFGP